MSLPVTRSSCHLYKWACRRFKCTVSECHSVVEVQQQVSTQYLRTNRIQRSVIIYSASFCSWTLCDCRKKESIILHMSTGILNPMYPLLAHICYKPLDTVGLYTSKQVKFWSTFVLNNIPVLKSQVRWTISFAFEHLGKLQLPQWFCAVLQTVSLLTRKALLTCSTHCRIFQACSELESRKVFWTLQCSQSQDSYFGSRCSFTNEQFILWDRKETAPGLCHRATMWSVSHWQDSALDWVTARLTKLRKQKLIFSLTLHIVLARVRKLWKTAKCI